MIKIILTEQTYPIRRAVLRKEFPDEPHQFNGDLDPHTFHLGYFEKDDIKGVVTIMKNGSVAQLRGMAVCEDCQGKGIGKMLIEEAEEILQKDKISKIWMNAREKAVPFYEKCGYKIEGEIFIIKPIGFHYLMAKYFD